MGRKRFRSNDRIYEEFPPEHPARRYLIRFYEIRAEVCGRDIDWPGRPMVEQGWESKLLKRRFSFSSFAYTFISYSLILDEWFADEHRHQPSGAEQECIRDYDMKLAILDECELAAKADANSEIGHFIDLCREVLRLGLDATADRTGTPPDELLRKYGQSAEERIIGFLQNC